MVYLHVCLLESRVFFMENNLKNKNQIWQMKKLKEDKIKNNFIL